MWAEDLFARFQDQQAGQDPGRRSANERLRLDRGLGNGFAEEPHRGYEELVKVLKRLLTKLGFAKNPQPPREQIPEPEHDASVESETDIPETVEIPVDGTLDLHIFRPSEVRDLVPAYLDECVERGIADVRIIHGKGTGSLRATVHACLVRHPRVVRYRTADDASGWGATLVTLDCRKNRTADSG